VVVVPTQSIPQGIAAFLAFNYQAGFEENIEAMNAARMAVQTIEITIAVRSVQIGGVPVKKGEIIALLDGDLGAHGENILTVISEVLEKTSADKKELITVYYGVEVDRVGAEEVARCIREKYPSQDVELVDGGQLFYHYLISVE
jgi:dihydroxyacetone kinase-like predicted kinase